MRVLLDTQIIYLAVDASLGKLPARTLKLFLDPDVERLISAVSIMEISVKSGAISMTEEQVRQAARDLYLTIIPFTPQHAYRMFSLPLSHRDPFDRMLIATALVEDIPIVGGDRIFKQYPGLKVIWK